MREIDKKFIGSYSEIDLEKYEYTKILKQVQNEINSIHTINKSTFYRLLDWKSPRIKGTVKNMTIIYIQKSLRNY